MAKLPETGPSLRRIIEQERRRVGRAENSSAFTRSGTSVTAENEVTVDGAFIVNGPLTVTQTADITGTTHIGGATDIDGTLNVDAAATFGGAVAITGTLSLPAGIIDNDALTSPVEVGDFDHSETAFDPPGGAWYTASSVTLTVPDGFTQAVVTAVAFAAIYNTAAADTTVHLRAQIAGANGSEDSVGTTAGQVKMLSMFPKRVISLTGGDTFTVACQTYSVTDFTAHATNNARISGTVLWLR